LLFVMRENMPKIGIACRNIKGEAHTTQKLSESEAKRGEKGIQDWCPEGARSMSAGPGLLSMTEGD